ncbi:MAG: RloB family protein [Clostridia bacterium]|nr:RloB family protein [Clostridia bacterium]
MKSKEAGKSKRKSNFLQIAPANYLIICEGKQTEPNYFNGLKQDINRKYGKKVEVLIPNIDIKGTGRNTTDLVKYTQKYVNYSNKVYGQVWVVFDKDDYSDEQFNQAIKNCDYNVAWSNPNFELWLLSHLKRVSKVMSKDEILDELDKEFQRNGLGTYKKNDGKIFEKVTKDRKLDIAIKNCEYMEKLNKNGQASDRNPMTRVYKIVDGLKEYLE